MHNEVIDIINIINDNYFEIVDFNLINQKILKDRLKMILEKETEGKKFCEINLARVDFINKSIKQLNETIELIIKAKNEILDYSDEDCKGYCMLNRIEWYDRTMGMVDELLEVEEGLSEWEISFIESMKKQDFSFSINQVNKIEQIWNRIFNERG